MGFLGLPDLGRMTGIKISTKGIKFAKPKLNFGDLLSLGLMALPGGAMAGNLGKMSLANLSTANMVKNAGIDKLLTGNIGKMGLADGLKMAGAGNLLGKNGQLDLTSLLSILAGGAGGSVPSGQVTPETPTGINGSAPATSTVAPMLVSRLPSYLQEANQVGAATSTPSEGSSFLPNSSKTTSSLKKVNTEATLNDLIKKLLGPAGSAVQHYTDRGDLRQDVLDQAVMNADPSNIHNEVTSQQVMIEAAAQREAKRRKQQMAMAGFDPSMAGSAGDEVMSSAVDDGNKVMRDMYDPTNIAKRREIQLGLLDPDNQLKELNAPMSFFERMTSLKPKKQPGTSVADTFLSLAGMVAGNTGSSGSSGGSSGGSSAPTGGWQNDPGIGSGTAVGRKKWAWE